MAERDSLEAHLGAMSSEELLRKADALRSLQEHPGWDVVNELIQVHVRKATHRLVHSPMRDVQAYAHSAGFIRGLEAVPPIIEKALTTANAVQRVLERDSDAGEPG
jgi:glutamyl-tRNA reductase